MVDGRQRHDWSIAAAVMSVIANANRDPKRSRPPRLLKPSDFDPFAQESRLVRVGVSVLKDVFIDRKVAKETHG